MPARTRDQHEHHAGRRKAWRWSKRILLGLVSVVVLAVAAVLVILHTNWGRDLARGQIEAQLNNTFVGGATIGALEGSPLGELVIRDLVINGPDGKPAISVRKLTLEIGLLALASKQAKLETLRAEDVDVDLRRDPDGTLQITRLTKPSGPKSGWEVEIPKVVVERAHVRYDAGTEIMNFDQLAITGGAHLPPDAPLAANLLVHGTWRERNAPIWVDTVVRNDWKELTVPSLLARVGDVTVIVAGLHVTKPQEAGLVFATPQPLDVAGIVSLRASKEAVAQLAPEVELPVDLDVNIIAAPLAGSATRLTVTGTVDGSPIRADVDADLTRQHAAGMVATGMLDVTKLSRGKLEGTAAGLVVFDLRAGEPGGLPIGTALIHASGELAGTPNAALAMTARSDGSRASTAVALDGVGVRANVTAELRKLGDQLTLERSSIIASVSDPSRATGGKAPLRGRFDVNLAASGMLLPRADLAVEGRMKGKRLRVQDLSIASVDFAIDAKHLPSRPTGKAELEARNIVRQDMFLRELDLTAGTREDGKIAVSVRSRPRTTPWLLEADALVAPGETVTIDLQRHHIRAGSGSDWRGTSGHITIGPERIDVRDLVSASRDGKLAIGGHFHRVGRKAGDLDARVDLTAFSLNNIDKGYAGTLAAHVDVQRRNGKFAGVIDLDAKGVALTPQVIPFDVDAKVEARADKLLIAATAQSPTLGTAKLGIDIDAPDDITNVAHWKKLHRRHIREGRIQLQGLDVAKIAQVAGLEGEHRGRIDGDIQLSETTTGGLIQITNLMTPALRTLGPVSANLNVSQSGPAELTPTLVATIDDRATAGSGTPKQLAKVEAQATLGIPDHLFDPAAWQRLGRGAFKGGSVRIADVMIEPALLDRLEVNTSLRGRATMVAEISEAARGAKVAVALREVRGKPIAQPISIDLLASIDNAETTATMSIVAPASTVAGKQPKASGLGRAVTLLDLRARIPLTLAELEADPRGALTKRIEATAKLPDVPAPQLLAVFGRTEVIGGMLTGTVDVGGTIGKPTVRARLAGTNLEVPPGPGNRPVKQIERIALDASWDGTQGKLAIDGTQQRGMLHVLVTGSPANLAGAALKLEAKAFDLEPLLAFAPGPAGGASGRLDANLTMQGLDPRRAKLAGELHLVNGRIPIAAQVGTLWRAKIDLVVRENDVKINVDGRLGGGSVKAEALLGLEGAMPTGGTATMTLREVSPIGVVEPDVNADVTAKLVRRDDAWVADIAVKNGVIKIPKDRGEKLKPAGAPPDMRFTDGTRMTGRPREAAPPDRPTVVMNVRLYSTYVESEEFRGLIKGQLEITSDAESVGMVGKIEADRGNLDLFGRRYQLERAVVRFDGSTDPLLDVAITHDFPEVTTVTQVRGRASKPELILRSDPGTYSQGQLLGFLLGGEPAGQPADGNPRDKAASAGASFVANKIGGYVRDALPIDVDVLRYESATSSSGAAIMVGTWITRSLFVAYRRRIEARPDENAGEGEVEYWLSRRVVVEGVIGDRGYNGVDLLWRKRY
ncbi:MAG: translocation/assembly module TamB domain-containing protein [Myxococcota bacterium]|nr:translocation/assembly module TamB domain-containing protein [Myxococcota bacterium]